MKKIYCKNCKYFRDLGGHWEDECKRFYEINEYDGYKEHVEEIEYKYYCIDLNENNDCKHYKKKHILGL